MLFSAEKIASCYFYGERGDRRDLSAFLVSLASSLPENSVFLVGGCELSDHREMTRRQLSLRETRVVIKIADIAIEVTSGAGVGFVVREHAPFVVQEDDPEVRICGHYGYFPDCAFDQDVFDTGEMWALYQAGDTWIWRLFSPKWDPVPHKLAIFSSDLLSGDVYLNPHPPTDVRFMFPLTHPLDKFLLNSLLARGRGVQVHACGIDDDGRGLLFVGVSGAGKTTMSRLWDGVPGVAVLSDDRVILRRQDGRFWIYGTPWPGEAGFASPAGVPLERVFVLSHASKNVVTDREPSPQIVTDFLLRSFVAYWDSGGMEYTLGFFDELIHTIPCHTLGFAPDRRVVDFVRSVK